MSRLRVILAVVVASTLGADTWPWADLAAWPCLVLGLEVHQP